ncbi:hypothetical protein PENSUB_235 [Penicillium subrubescens]|uniref:Chitinase n=1 Tax=Penicillium subrubescens TaxID=1316194 RepID=A0A1Q5UNB2_9EURO|nr:hypothetical protein PENSUB_235 [Penicillium subrubescens]
MNGIDGVDFDWEYSGEPDIDSIPAGSDDDDDHRQLYWPRLYLHWTGFGCYSGRCTQTAGYIANAEIDEIISIKSNVQILFDDDSDLDIIVYNDTQWVGYLTTTTKSTRTTYYKGLNMGGTTEWAIDLEQFVDDPDGLVLLDPDVVDLASLLTNFGGALGLVSGLTGDGSATTLRAGAGGIFSEAGSNVSSDDDNDSTTELTLDTKISDLYTAFYYGVTNALK